MGRSATSLAPHRCQSPPIPRVRRPEAATCPPGEAAVGRGAVLCVSCSAHGWGVRPFWGKMTLMGNAVGDREATCVCTDGRLHKGSVAPPRQATVTQPRKGRRPSARHDCVDEPGGTSSVPRARHRGTPAARSHSQCPELPASCRREAEWARGPRWGAGQQRWTGTRSILEADGAMGGTESPSIARSQVVTVVDVTPGVFFHNKTPGECATETR